MFLLESWSSNLVSFDALLDGKLEAKLWTMTQSSPAELLEHALKLPPSDRLALATELLDSVEGPDDPEWAAAWAAELDRRVKELDAGTVKSIPWDQVKSETLKR